MKKLIVLCIFALVVTASCSTKNDRWKVISSEKGTITQKIQPGQHGGLTNEGTPNSVYVINGKLHESEENFNVNDQVLIITSIWNTDSSRTQIEIRKL